MYLWKCMFFHIIIVVNVLHVSVNFCGHIRQPKHVECLQRLLCENSYIFTFTYLLTYLLTYSMVQGPSWEANWFAACQEIPGISRNPKVHYHTHKRPPTLTILGQPNPFHIPTSHFLEIHPNIIHPSMPRFPSGLLPSGFPSKTLYTPSPHPYAPLAQPISFFSILSPAQYWVRSIDHLTPRYFSHVLVSFIPAANHECVVMKCLK